MSISSNNWKYYQLQLNKYIDILIDNPYVDELKQDFKIKKINRIVSPLNDKFKVWIRDLIIKDIISEEYIDKINNYFTTDIAVKYFANYIMENYSDLDTGGLFGMLKNNLEKVAKEINDKTPKLKLNPGKLKFVTSTAIAYLNTSIDFKKI